MFNLIRCPIWLKSFWLGLSNLTRYIGQISHLNQVDWPKNACFEPPIKMDMSISKKWLVSQFELFEKLCFVVVSSTKKIVVLQYTIK
jgi:hypothetical protein